MNQITNGTSQEDMTEANTKTLFITSINKILRLKVRNGPQYSTFTGLEDRKQHDHGKPGTSPDRNFHLGELDRNFDGARLLD